MEGETLRSFKELHILINDTEKMKKPIPIFCLRNLSSSSLGRYKVMLSLDQEFLEILQLRHEILKSQKYEETQERFLEEFMEGNLLKNPKQSIRYLDNLLRQGIRDVLIRSGLHTPPEIDGIIKKTVDKNLAIIPDSGIISRAILSQHLANHLVLLGSQQFYVAIPRSVLWELENNASSSNPIKKRIGFRGLQEVHTLKKYPSHIFTIQTPDNLSLPSRTGDRPSVDALVRYQIREYARIYYSLVKTCFITCDKINYIVSRIEGIDCYNINIGDIFSVPQKIKMPFWSHLYGRVYVPASNLIYESAICFGEIKIVDAIDPTKCDLSVTITGDFPEKRAQSWITGATKINLEKGDDQSILHDLEEPSKNVQIVQNLI